jgi:hypothetical protein
MPSWRKTLVAGLVAGLPRPAGRPGSPAVHLRQHRRQQRAAVQERRRLRRPQRPRHGGAHGRLRRRGERDRHGQRRADHDHRRHQRAVHQLGRPRPQRPGDGSVRGRLRRRGGGIFTGPDPSLDAVIRIGDPLFGSSVTALGFWREGLNNAGQLAFSYRLADDRSGIARADPLTAVPAPASLALLGVGVVAAGLGLRATRRRGVLRRVAPQRSRARAGCLPREDGAPARLLPKSGWAGAIWGCRGVGEARRQAAVREGRGGGGAEARRLGARGRGRPAEDTLGMARLVRVAPSAP